MAVAFGLAMVAMPGVAGAACGDALPDLGEDCDLGGSNGDPTTCCTASCTFRPAGDTCRALAGDCDVVETCTGASDTCPADSVAGAFVECRPAAGDCDLADNCDGVNVTCPADASQPDGTACDDGVTCSTPDTCQSGVCVGDPDGDTDTVCDGDDNCPAAANPGQEDLDGDNVGDVCDGADGALNPTWIQLRLNSIAPNDNSALKARGDFLTIPPDAFNASAPITLTLGDGSAVPNSRTTTWPPAQCTSTARRIKCTTPDRQRRAVFITSPSGPGIWKFKARFRKQNLLGVLEGPASATLSYGSGIDRTGTISDCKQSFANNSGLTCADTL
jgi:hypothetical protein